MSIQDFTTQSIIRQNAEENRAAEDISLVYKGAIVRIEKIALDNGYGPDVGQNPYPINYSFKAVFVRDVTDSTVTVNLALHDDSTFALQNAVQLRTNDSFKLKGLVKKGAITAAKQPGKSVTLYFIIEGEFVSGSQLSIAAGGSVITEGTAVSEQGLTPVTSVAALVSPANSSAKVVLIENWGCEPVYIGGADVTDYLGAKPGIGIPAGGSRAFKNQGALYAISSQPSLVNSVVQS